MLFENSTSFSRKANNISSDTAIFKFTMFAFLSVFYFLITLYTNKYKIKRQYKIMKIYYILIILNLLYINAIYGIYIRSYIIESNIILFYVCMIIYILKYLNFLQTTEYNRLFTNYVIFTASCAWFFIQRIYKEKPYDSGAIYNYSKYHGWLIIKKFILDKSEQMYHYKTTIFFKRRIYNEYRS